MADLAPCCGKCAGCDRAVGILVRDAGHAWLDGLRRRVCRIDDPALPDPAPSRR